MNHMEYPIINEAFRYKENRYLYGTVLKSDFRVLGKEYIIWPPLLTYYVLSCVINYGFFTKLGSYFRESNIDQERLKESEEQSGVDAVKQFSP